MYRHIPFTIVTIGVGTIVAALALALGGLLAGWDIWSMLVSPTAWLVYTLIFGIAVIALFKYFFNRDSR